ncbi:hypothetical protein B0H34DRAFT_785703 [Crassisporium funariophilum]|nr:hypothetical protein B0H34DRAFT_785703 [Crassisporium funariophilum]
MQLLFPSPPIDTSSAHLISLTFGLIYVGSLYLSKHARLSFTANPRPQPHAGAGDGTGPREKMKDERWRDDADVIRARLAAVCVATGVCCFGVFGVLWYRVGGDVKSVTPLLFLGPLFASYLGGELPFQRNWAYATHVRARFFSLQGVRNYMLAPLTEEIVFRACVLSIYHLSGAGTKRMIYLGPLTFGMAHIHHAWETYNRYGRTSSAAKRALIMSLFQLSYTTLFGIHASFLFLRTRSLLPPLTAHVWCNIMGVPEVGYEMRRFPKYRTLIIAMYLIGVAAFVYTLARWTETTGNFYWPREGEEAFSYGKY